MERLRLIVVLLVATSMLLSPVLPAFADETYDYTSPYGTRVIETWFTRNEAGMLIGQTGTITADGLTTDGDAYHIVTGLTYETINGKAVLTESYSTADYSNPDGSERHDITKVTYTNDENGVLIGASGTRTFSGYEKDIKDGDTIKKGNYYEGGADLTYAVIEGEAVVSSATVRTWQYLDSTKADGTFLGYSTTTTGYEYVTKLGTPRLSKTTSDTYSEDYRTQDLNGNFAWRYEHSETTYTYNEAGTLTGASGSGSAAGVRYDETNGWIAYTSTITLTYELKNGAAFLSYRKEEEYWEAADPPEPPQPADPEVTGTLVGKHTFVIGNKTERFGVIRDANGRLWLIRLNAAEYNLLAVGGGAITVSGDKTNPSKHCFILDNLIGLTIR